MAISRLANSNSQSSDQGSRWMRALTAGFVCVSLLGTAGFACAAEHVVTIRDYRFTPAEITIQVGDTVRWVNAEKRTSHSVLFDGPPTQESERVFPDESWSRRFDAPGKVPYGCGPHPEMRGMIVVVD